MRPRNRFNDRRAYSVETRSASTHPIVDVRIHRVTPHRQCVATRASMPRCANRRRWQKLDAADCSDSSARSLAWPRRRSSLIRVGVGIAVGLGFRDVLFGIVLRLLDRRMRPRRVRFPGIALYVFCCVRIDRRFDIRALVAAFARARRLDGSFVPRIVRMCLHGIVHWSRSRTRAATLASVMPRGRVPRASWRRGACDVSTNDLSFIAIRIATRAAAQAANEFAIE
jgi:hypothetical protein